MDGKSRRRLALGGGYRVVVAVGVIMGVRLASWRFLVANAAAGVLVSKGPMPRPARLTPRGGASRSSAALKDGCDGSNAGLVLALCPMGGVLWGGLGPVYIMA